MPSKKQNGRKKTRRMVLILCSVLIIIAGLGGGAWAYVSSLINAPHHMSLDQMPIRDRSDLSLPEEDLSVPSSKDPQESSPFAEDLSSDPDIMNIMLYGSDQRPGDEGAYGNSDAMVLLSIDQRHHALKLTSFMRDTWVQVPGKREYRLNSAYLMGGPRLSIETVEKNFGIKIDKYAVVDFNSFSKIVDTLGGITIDITNKEADYLNKIYHTSTFQEGPRKMNGDIALNYARARKLDGDDFGRTQRHRTVLMSVVNQFKSSSLPQITQALNQIMPMITTDLSSDEMLEMLPHTLEYMNYGMKQYRLPEDGSYSEKRYYYNDFPMDVMVIDDLASTRTKLRQFIYEN